MKTIKRLIIIFFLMISPIIMIAQDGEPESGKRKLRTKSEFTISDTLTDAFLDTINVKKKLRLNDYSLLGFQYGASLSQVMWNPTRNQKMLLMPVNFGVTYTLYGKMFGYMPYFGFQTGVIYGREGYEFKANEETGRIHNIVGAKKAVMDVIEVPILSHIHFDFWHFKIIAQIGMFAGYRMTIHRYEVSPGTLDESIARSFLKTDNRFDFGLKGGIGFGLVFDPLELHIQAMYKHSFSTLYEPDVNSTDYYEWSYPSNIILSAGLHFQLTKRSGMTNKEIKKQARSIVYEN